MKKLAKTIVTAKGIYGSLFVWNDYESDFQLYNEIDFSSWDDQNESDLALAKNKAEQFDLRDVKLETFFYEIEIEVAAKVADFHGFDFREWHEEDMAHREASGFETETYEAWLERFKAILFMNDDGHTFVQFREDQLIGDRASTGDDMATRTLMETMLNIALIIQNEQGVYGLVASQKEVEELGFNFPDHDNAEGFCIIHRGQKFMLTACTASNDTYEVFGLSDDDVELLAFNLPGGFNVSHICVGNGIETIIKPYTI